MAIHAWGYMDARTVRAMLPQKTLNLLAALLVLGALGCGGGDVTPPPSTGTLEVNTSTSGTEQDPDGYSLRMDAGALQAIGTAATLTTSDVTPGNHMLLLGEVASNCSVSGDNPRAVSVTAGEKATVAFAVTCSATTPTTGIIRVSVSTSGSPTDPDGYLIKLDGADPGLSSGTSGSVSFTSVAAGSHEVALTGIATNCSVADGVSRPVTVTASATSDISFVVTCAPTTGSIKVTTVTTGVSGDADGYTVSVDEGIAQTIGLNATIGIPNVATGDHSVALGGIAANCTVEGANPRAVTVTPGHEGTIDFTVTCTAVAVTHWATIPLPSGVVGTGLWASSPSDVFVTGRDQVSFDRFLLHYDGHNWTKQLDEDVNAVWGRSPTDVFVAGDYFVWHYDGTGWLPFHEGEVEAGNALSYAALWGTSRELFAAGVMVEAESFGASYGLIDRYDGATWSPLLFWTDIGSGYQAWVDFYDVGGSSPTDVYVLAQHVRFPPLDEDEIQDDHTDHVVWHSDGAGWTVSYDILVRPGEHYRDLLLRALWVNAPDDVFVVGMNGRILHSNGSDWSPMSSPTTQTIHDVWGNASSNVYAVGDGGILHYDGTRWSVVNSAKGNRVWGVGSEVFVISDGALLHGTP